jgi:hypothetical protein
VNITAKIDASVEDMAKEAKVVFDEQFAKAMSRTNTELGTESD